jgi:hypothetical protein
LKQRSRLASIVAWWLLLVYVLVAMAVYAFTFA